MKKTIKKNKNNLYLVSDSLRAWLNQRHKKNRRIALNLLTTKKLCGFGYPKGTRPFDIAF